MIQVCSNLYTSAMTEKTTSSVEFTQHSESDHLESLSY